MKTIELALQPVEGYLISITRNLMDGWYEIEIGIPNNWVFDENNEIKCEILAEDNKYKAIKISPKNRNIVIDDLIAFFEIIINTNKKIAEKEEEFKLQMEEMKKGLEKKASAFFKELDELKENSFKKINDNFVKNIHKDNDDEKKSKKTRQPKVISSTGETSTTKTTTELLEIDKE
jgi:uncharacterized protein with von Willebrand factor type A (vWA) domain